jgi:T4-like virus tail tube protein gp19.
MNYFADAVSIPSRNITTGDIKNVGIGRKYATGQTENQLTISFMLTKSSWHRNFFEKWMQKIAPDSENRVGFYDDYTTDIYVRKWERGSNYLNHVKQGGTDYFSRMNKAVGIYQFAKCFPVNMGGLEFSNDGGGVLKMNMLFNYERYRFTTKVQKPKDWTEDKVITENLDVAQALGLGTDTNTQFGI